MSLSDVEIPGKFQGHHTHLGKFQGHHTHFSLGLFFLFDFCRCRRRRKALASFCRKLPKPRGLPLLADYRHWPTSILRDEATGRQTPLLVQSFPWDSPRPVPPEREAFCMVSPEFPRNSRVMISARCRSCLGMRRSARQ